MKTMEFIMGVVESIIILIGIAIIGVLIAWLVSFMNMNAIEQVGYNIDVLQYGKVSAAMMNLEGFVTTLIETVKTMF